MAQNQTSLHRNMLNLKKISHHIFQEALRSDGYQMYIRGCQSCLSGSSRSIGDNDGIYGLGAGSTVLPGTILGRRKAVFVVQKFLLPFLVPWPNVQFSRFEASREALMDWLPHHLFNTSSSISWVAASKPFL
jgi:hypothetical protein